MSPKESERMIREIEINSQIDHPNCVQVFEVYRSKEEICIIMEFMSGGELFDRVAKNGPMTEDVAKESLKGVLSAVQYLHGLGIAHRDLKPENILFESKEKDAKAKLIDFGFAKKVHGHHVLVTPIGTPAYAAPDIIRSETYTPAVDMWSIGCILYFMLFARPPFHSDKEEEIMDLVTRGRYDLPENIPISDEAQDLISHLLEKKPDKRYTATHALNHPWIKGKQNTLSFSNESSHVPYHSESTVNTVRQSMNVAIDKLRNQDDGISQLNKIPFQHKPATESALWKKRTDREPN